MIAGAVDSSQVREVGIRERERERADTWGLFQPLGGGDSDNQTVNDGWTGLRAHDVASGRREPIKLRKPE